MKIKHIAKRTQHGEPQHREHNGLTATGLIILFITVLLLNTTLSAQVTERIGRKQESKKPVTPAVPAPPPARTNTVNTFINLEIEAPPGLGTAGGETDETAEKILTKFLKIALIVDKRNQQALYMTFTEKATQRIARFLENASKLETDECYKQYLDILSQNVLENGNFNVTLPRWTNLEGNRLEIVFPQDERYGWKLQAYELFFNVPAPGNARDQGRGIEALVYLNDPEETQKCEEYTDLVGKMQYNLPSTPASRKKDVTYAVVPPVFKAVQLLYAPRPNGFTRIYPELNFKNEPGAGTDNIPGKKGFKIIIFKNLVNAYLEGVIKPIAAQVLADERMWDVDYDAYISNLLMTRISHHLGPVFVVKFKDEEEQIPAWQQYMKRRPKQLKVKKKKEKELKLIRDVLGDLFPVIETVKARAIALHNTEVLIKNGLLPADRDIAVYSTYMISLINDLRDKPDVLPGGQAGRKRMGMGGKQDPISVEKSKAALVQFNHFLKEEAIIFNISNQTLDIDRIKFKEAAEKLAKDVLVQLSNANYITANAFIQRNLDWPPQLDEILSKLVDMPLDVEFQLPEMNLDKMGMDEKDMEITE